MDGEPELERARVLVVDDEPGIVDVISMALRHHGFDVEAAENGKDALDRARRWRPHVMVLDVMLPDMEGFEVARRLSADRAAVPITTSATCARRSTQMVSRCCTRCAGVGYALRLPRG